MTRHERYNRSEKGRARSRRYNRKRGNLRWTIARRARQLEGTTT